MQITFGPNKQASGTQGTSSFYINGRFKVEVLFLDEGGGVTKETFTSGYYSYPGHPTSINMILDISSPCIIRATEQFSNATDLDVLRDFNVGVFNAQLEKTEGFKIEIIRYDSKDKAYIATVGHPNLHETQDIYIPPNVRYLTYGNEFSLVKNLTLRGLDNENLNLTLSRYSGLEELHLPEDLTNIRGITFSNLSTFNHDLSYVKVKALTVNNCPMFEESNYPTVVETE